MALPQSLEKVIGDFDGIFWYRKDIVKSPPKTWDGLISAAEKMGGKLEPFSGPSPLAPGAKNKSG